MFQSVWKSRNLLANLVRRDLTVRYKATVMGFFWSFAKPLAYMVIYQVVFGQILALQIRESRIPYALHILAAILPWTFFTGATSEAMNSILGSANLIKKVKLPLEVFPLAAVVSQAIHFALAMIVLVAGMIVYGIAPGPGILLLPVLAAIQFVLILAVSLLLASLNVFYRDVASIWEVGLAAWFYATPIIYPAYYATEYFAQRGMGWAQWLYLANP
ncbi:ABC transporter permease, partial [Candidatus Sumerlaeota bacterium]|nr:ABC transporter permease [Candidatus Sumerlaeota bacterium]